MGKKFNWGMSAVVGHSVEKQSIAQKNEILQSVK